MPRRRSAVRPRNARNVRAGPAAGVLSAARGVVTEIGREQHRALEQVLQRRAGDTQRKPAAGGVTDQRQRRGRDWSCGSSRRNPQGRPRAGRDRRYRRACRMRHGRECRARRFQPRARRAPLPARGRRCSIPTSRAPQWRPARSPASGPDSVGNPARCRRGPENARCAGMVLRSTARAVVEIEVSSGGRRSGEAISAPSTRPAKPMMARPQTSGPEAAGHDRGDHDAIPFSVTNF